MGPLDTLYGIHNTLQILYTTRPTDTSLWIATLDSCLNSSPMSLQQRNMQLAATYDRCVVPPIYQVSYDNMTGLAKYEIYYSIDNNFYMRGQTMRPYGIIHLRI